MHTKQECSKKSHTSKRVDAESIVHSQKGVDISKLKDFAEHNLPLGSPLRYVIVYEKDILTAEKFLAKLPIWLRLKNLSTKN